jgi:DNA-directed RNA polymerase specialized sigma24 family protein
MTNEENRIGNIGKIIELFEPKIKKSMIQTAVQDREDLFQELQIKLFESIQKYDMDRTPGFNEFKELVKKTG